MRQADEHDPHIEHHGPIGDEGAQQSHDVRHHAEHLVDGHVTGPEHQKMTSITASQIA